MRKLRRNRQGRLHRASDIISRYAAENGDVVADAPGEHKEVPDAVTVPELFVEDVKNDAARIQHSAGREQGEPGGRKGAKKRADGDDYEPSHEKIDHDGENALPLRDEELLRDAERRKAPDGAEERPATGPPQGDEGEGRV